MQRRGFLKSLGAFFVTLGVAVLGYPAIRFLAPPADTSAAKKLVVDKSEMPSGSFKEVTYQGTPVIVLNRREVGFIAFSRVCTHLGCLVGYDKAKGRLVCPCHGGEFNLDGRVLAGPPPKPLDRIPIEIEADRILIG